MQDLNIREIIKKSVADKPNISEEQIDKWTSQVENLFGLDPGETPIHQKHGEKEWPDFKCIACVAGTIALAAAIVVAVAALVGPLAPGALVALASQFGVSLEVIQQAVAGAGADALAKAICDC